MVRAIIYSIHEQLQTFIIIHFSGPVSKVCSAPFLIQFSCVVPLSRAAHESITLYYNYFSSLVFNSHFNFQSRDGIPDGLKRGQAGYTRSVAENEQESLSLNSPSFEWSLVLSSLHATGRYQGCVRYSVQYLSKAKGLIKILARNHKKKVSR